MGGTIEYQESVNQENLSGPVSTLPGIVAEVLDDPGVQVRPFRKGGGRRKKDA
ncbi:hypothetical protein ASZ90_017050 [hydrocarbon metagenome]|uniref:Uncharacterized protein n=1 Tax=hydrocarbon metagenome TaxID=938273 RepID=A0A0W8EAG2_9ZZZZ